MGVLDSNIKQEVTLVKKYTGLSLSKNNLIISLPYAVKNYQTVLFKIHFNGSEKHRLQVHGSVDDAGYHYLTKTFLINEYCNLIPKVDGILSDGGTYLCDASYISSIGFNNLSLSNDTVDISIYGYTNSTSNNINAQEIKDLLIGIKDKDSEKINKGVFDLSDTGDIIRTRIEKACTIQINCDVIIPESVDSNQLYLQLWSREEGLVSLDPIIYDGEGNIYFRKLRIQSFKKVSATKYTGVFYVKSFSSSEFRFRNDRALSAGCNISYSYTMSSIEIPTKDLKPRQLLYSTSLNLKSIDKKYGGYDITDFYIHKAFKYVYVTLTLENSGHHYANSSFYVTLQEHVKDTGSMSYSKRIINVNNGYNGYSKWEEVYEEVARLYIDFTGDVPEGGFLNINVYGVR